MSSQCAKLCPACEICRQMCSRWKPSCTSPALVAALGPAPALSCQIHCSDHPRWQEALGAAQPWTCQLGLLSRAPRCKRQLSRLFTCFSNFGLGTVRREAMQKAKGRSFYFFFFLLTCLKRQGCWNVRRGLIWRKREDSWLRKNFFLSFHTDLLRKPPSGISGNLDWSSWRRKCRQDLLQPLGFPMQMVMGFHTEADRLCIQVWAVTTFRFVLPGCSYFWGWMIFLAKTLASRPIIHQAVP